MKTPLDLLYSSNHVWIKIEGNTALIGITDYAQQQLGDVIYIDVNSLGNQLKLGEIFGTVEAIKTVSDLFMPVDGKVLEMNLELEHLPDLVNTDPYGKGWIIKVQIQNNTLLDQLLNAEDYKKLVT
ncbi:glycine cleavage system protein GcvH [Apibacter sp. B3889]|uniref:glycine cleavage system protein GcvH n=1 Tax=unclassified Apibacter TaxID=2630820 RepID=UPI0013268278|nr:MULTISPECIES: glycine cleavage system protein GcvH [unclassified Apibacter]MXO31544.1 glycine cleavage system protein GcvH [Apibacter sp. B2912]MXO34055.1 glycine cleavage system protein GcvH [Apibacter sp. B3883]MXO41814.1 glycine cleavage system protein GcvH [Apibacter sp. B3889]MXP03384.1 glycine cleavage system protein GcvH [Apibacter sp. B3887]MXP07353.1 glycine cleavage system protein GcvH [Apibacter sp. B3935]